MGNLSGTQDIASYTFNVSAPGTMVFDLLESSGAQNYLSSWQVSGPLGVVRDWTDFGSTDGGYDAHLLSLPAGQYTLSVRSREAQGINFKFRMLTREVATTIQPGTVVQAKAEPSYTTQLFQFSGTKGSRMRFDGISGSRVFSLIDPYGRVIKSINTQYDEMIELPTTGDYLAVLSGHFGENLGNSVVNYSFNLIPEVVQQAGLSLNSVIQGSIQQFGRVEYSFTLERPSTIMVAPGRGEASWSLQGPRGSEASDRAFRDEPGVFELPAGEYRFTVQASADSKTDFNFKLTDLAQAASLELGSAARASFTPDNRVAVYSITVPESREFVADVVANSSTQYWDTRWSLLNLRGQSVTAGNGKDDSQPFTLAAGKYYFVLNAASNISAELELGLRPVTTKVVNISVDTDVLSALDTPGQRAEFTFSMAAPGKLLFDKLVSSGEMHWELIGPKGNLQSGYFADDEYYSYNKFIEADQAGEYTLRVRSLINAAGPIGFRIHNLSTIPSQPLLGTQSIALTPGNAARILAFEAKAGDYFSYQGLSLSAGKAKFAVVNANGEEIISLRDATGAISQSLPAAGRYYLLLAGDIDNQLPLTWEFDARLARSQEMALSLNANARGRLATNSLTDTWNFSLASAQRLTFDGVAGDKIGWSLLNASGSVLASDTDLRNLRTFELAAGNYRLVLRGNGAANAVPGEYAFRLLD